MLAVYLAAALVAGLAAVVVLAAGNRDHQPAIAGGYDLVRPNDCLAGSFELLQSGRYVDLSSVRGGVEGSLELDAPRLHGDVDCSGGGRVRLEAEVRGAHVEGTLGGERLAAERRRDPPPPGAPKPGVPRSINGEYALSPQSACLGSKLELDERDGGRIEAKADERSVGELLFADGTLHGSVRCSEGEPRSLIGEVAGRNIFLTLGGPKAERVTAHRTREAESLFAAFFVAIAVVILAARLGGLAAARLGQARVMGEVLAGIALGPTLLGAVAPGAQATLFPEDVVPLLSVASQLGLTFYMFLLGLELDFAQLRGRIGQVAAISNASVALPMALGLAVAVPIFDRLGPDTSYAGFALFMGVSMSITAFPVLARILVERRMVKRPVGALVLACAAVDDVTAWVLIALAAAITAAGSSSAVLVTALLLVGFLALMWFGVRRLVGRVAVAYEETGNVSGGWVAAILAGVLLSAWATQAIGVALIFGAFVMGLVMPRHADLTEDVTHRLEDFVVILLLPLFFVSTGLRTDVGLLNRPVLWALTATLIVVAVAGKLGGASLAARAIGYDARSSVAIGALLNTRGLTELIVLNLALELGVITPVLFTMLVLMALVTTLMTVPLLNRIDPRNELGASVAEELAAAAKPAPELPGPEESILLCPQGDTLGHLVTLAEPLARSEPPRELLVARLLRPRRGAQVRGGLQTENFLLEEATRELEQEREQCAAKGVAMRGVAFISSDPGADLVRLSRDEDVAFLLVDGHRPLLGAGVPRGEVGEVLRDAPCDVAVLVAREDRVPVVDDQAGVLVPFGGAEHDWAALELGAWIAAANGAPLSLLGAARESEDPAKVTRLLGDAGLLVQQYAGIAARPLIAPAGREGIVEAAKNCGLLCIGLSHRWREEGLGPTRSEIARAAPAPVLFVRRGVRQGALAPREDVTRFSWSAAGMGARINLGPTGAIE